MSDVQEVHISTGGRPKKFFKVNGVLMDKEEYQKFKAVEKVVPQPVVMTPEEFASFSRMAIPELMHKAYLMAKQTDDPKVVLAVLKEFADRGFGKAVQSVEVNLGPDVRGAWKQLETFDRPVIEQEAEETQD